MIQERGIMPAFFPIIPASLLFSASKHKDSENSLMAILEIVSVTAGAVLGVALDRQEKEISRTLKIAKGLGPSLRRLDCKLKSAELLISKLDLPEKTRLRVTAILEDGNKLVLKCQNVRCLNIWKKWRYATKVTKLEAVLTDTIEMLLQFEKSSARSGSWRLYLRSGAAAAMIFVAGVIYYIWPGGSA